jgi:hypothetical protein
MGDVRGGLLDPGAHASNEEGDVAEIAPVRDNPNDKEPRKAHYGDGEQPWDVILKAGWGPHFAAACIVRYLRRDKAKEHSLESAKWYMARIMEGCEGNINSPSPIRDWSFARFNLHLILNIEEKSRLNG